MRDIPVPDPRDRSETHEALRETYEPPRLTVLGTARDLTLTKNPGANDGINS